MITRHHVLLGVLCSFFPGIVIAGWDPAGGVLLSAGTVAGVILPDIHMTRPKKNVLLALAWGVVQAGRISCMPLLCTIYRRVFRSDWSPRDKRLTHSVPGILWYLSLVAGIAGIAALLSGTGISVSPSLYLICGLALGLILHLVQDLCTRKGIYPLFPFHGLKVSGSIRACNILDPRIRRYHLFHGSVLFLFAAFRYATAWPAGELLLWAFLALGMCLIAMIALSDVEIEYPAADPVAGEAAAT